MTLPLTPGRWAIDPAHSTVEFSVRHLGISKVRGSFHKFTAQIDVGDTLAMTQFSAEVDLSSVDTRNADRDQHLQSSDFFNIEKHPKMTFVSTWMTTVDADTYELGGELTINGLTKPQTFNLEFTGTAIFPGDGVLHAGFAATGSLSRSDFGIDFDIPLAAGGFVVGDKVQIELNVELTSL